MAFFEKADKLLKQSLDPAKNMSLFKNNYKSAIQFANDVIEGKHTIAKRENEFIYHEKVPEDLPDLKGKD